MQGLFDKKKSLRCFNEPRWLDDI